MERLNCTVNNYSWGKKGNDSEVAKLFAAGHEDFQISPILPYSELWMGTHPDGPAKLRNSAVNLSEFIAKNNDLEGVEEEVVHLPFIMKIMSISHSLSLQVHPTKKQAEYLHKKDPKNYPDCNHKPELAYALTKFELLCGFRPASEILQNIQAFPELRTLMGENETEEFERLVTINSEDTARGELALKRCFTTLLYSQIKTPTIVEEMLKSFYEKIENGTRGALIEDTIAVLNSLKENFPGDIGCFSPLFLNHIILQPGECCFYDAGELHAYLSGECVECVGCSNNTIRAALTPKFIDREAVTEVTNFKMANAERYLVPANKLEDFPHLKEFSPNCKDFILNEIQLISSNAYGLQTLSIWLPPLQSSSIMIIVEGNGKYKMLGEADEKLMKRGDIFYIAPGQNVELESCCARFLAFRTFSFEKNPKLSKRQVG